MCARWEQIAQWTFANGLEIEDIEWFDGEKKPPFGKQKKFRLKVPPAARSFVLFIHTSPYY